MNPKTPATLDKWFMWENLYLALNHKVKVSEKRKRQARKRYVRVLEGGEDNFLTAVRAQTLDLQKET